MKDSKYKFNTIHKKIPADYFTPVELYLKIREKYKGVFLLESSDYESVTNSFTYICFDPIARFTVDGEQTLLKLPDNSQTLQTQEIDIAESLNEFLSSFESQDFGFDFETNGLFGYTSYDAIPLFQPIKFKKSTKNIPLIDYYAFRYVLVFNHFRSAMHCFEHLLFDEESQLYQLEEIIQSPIQFPKKFKLENKEEANCTNDEFLEKIKQGLKHCYRGDVFQVVLSREFTQEFSGDDFQLYRALRSINPSPYLFYFDLNETKIFGSSPEAQLIIKDSKSYINPIAGTFRRTGDNEKDKILAEQLLNDPKENAEHVMLVDLARNDLSISGANINVERYKEIEYYSHVIHLVSKVSADLPEAYNAIKILGETYPAGTLSGAPKHRAMQIIDDNEPDTRGFYGGTVGFLGFNGTINHAIFIRSFMSQNNKLHYRAGCGVVIHSKPESELQEVNNKLAALRTAMKTAEDY